MTTPPSWTKTVGRTLLAGALVGGSAGFFGCRGSSGGPVVAKPLPPLAEAVMARPSRRFRAAAVQPPPGKDFQAIAPVRGGSERTALTDLLTLRAEVVFPPYLQREPAVSEVPEPGEPPLAAQRSFVAGRAAWREGRSEEALQHLKLTLHQVPQDAELLRLIGQVEASRGQRVAAAEYFRRALALEPADPETALFLGRFAAEQERFAEALACYLHVEALLQAFQEKEPAPRIDPALRPLLHFHLAQALRQHGYLDEALRQYEAYLQTPREAVGGTPLMRELIFLDHQAAPATYQTLGDLHLQLDRPGPARLCFDRVAALLPRKTYALLGRQVYTDLRLGEVEAAQRRTIAWIATAPHEPKAVKLVHYLVAQGVSPRHLAAEIEEVYASQGQPSLLAIALAGLLPSAQGQALLIGHLRDRPGDQVVYLALARSILGDTSLREGLEAGSADAAWEDGPAEADAPLRTLAAAASPQAWSELIAVTMDLMVAAPEEAVAKATLFLRFVHEPRALLPLFDLPSASPLQLSADWQMLRGMLLAAADQGDDAKTAFERALALDPQRAESRIRLAGLALASGEVSAAREWLEPLSDQDDGRVLLMRVRMLAAEKQPAEALERLEQLLAADPGRAGTAFYLEKAQLQLHLGQPEAAEKTLLALLETRPQEEAIYAALFGIYDRHPQMVENYKRLMNHMLRLIPESRIALLKRAELLEAGGQLDQALPLIDRLLTRQPRDLAALRLKLIGLHRAGRGEEALALMDSTLSGGPEDPRLLQFFHEFAQRTGHTDKALDYLQRIVAGRPEGFERSRSLAAIHYQRGAFSQALAEVEQALARGNDQEPVVLIYLQWRSLERLGRVEEAEASLREAIVRYPKHRGDFFYELSLLLHQAGRLKEAEEATGQVVLADPTHGPGNNALAYALALRGERLEDALAMVRRALAADPDLAAYLDTKGWVLYKLGRFEEALSWLDRSLRQVELEQQAGRDMSATRAVVQDHRGDALYRLGQPQEARGAWEAARSLADDPAVQEQMGIDPELTSLAQRVTAKLQALSVGDPVPVEPLPAEE